MATMGDQLPWDGSHYKQNEKLEDPIFAERFPLPDEFLSGSGTNKKINLHKVSENLPTVVTFLKNKRRHVQERENVERTNEFEKPTKISEYLKKIFNKVTLKHKSTKEAKKRQMYANPQLDHYVQHMLKQEFKYVYFIVDLKFNYCKYLIRKELEYQGIVSKHGRMETQELEEVKARVENQVSQFKNIVSGQVLFEKFLQKRDQKDKEFQTKSKKGKKLQRKGQQDKEVYEMEFFWRFLRHTTKIIDLLQKYNSEYDTRIQQLKRYLYVDCEYVLSMSLPSGKDGDLWSFIWNNHNETIDIEKVDRDLRPRWVFIPSCDRYNKPNINLNRCSNVDKNPNDENTNGHDYTISILVVRPSQFAMYYKVMGAECPIIQLPENVVGVGYARYWIVKIAKHFKLGKIWMCDDSIDWFKEYKPLVTNGKVCKDPSGSEQVNLLSDTRAFKAMEKIMEDHSDLAIICPRRHRRNLNMTKEFTYKPPGGVCLLNIAKIDEHNLNYRPELPYLEDVIFALECDRANLQVCVWNAIIFLAKNFAGTGANIDYTSPD